MRYVKLREVCTALDVSEELLRTMIEEGLVEVKHTLDDDEVLSVDDADRVRVGAMLVRDMDVNLPGVEVILHMREEIVAMQKQFHEVLEALVAELRGRDG